MKLFEVGYVLKVVDQFSGAFKSFNNQMKGVSEAVERTRGLRQMAENVGKVGLVTGAMGAAIALPIKAAIEGADALDDHINRVMVATGKMNDMAARNQITKFVEDQAIATGYSVNDLTEAVYQGASGFLNFKDSMDVATISAKLARVTNGDLIETTNMLTTGIINFGDKSKTAVQNAQIIADKYAVIQEQFKYTNLGDLTYALRIAAPTMSGYGVSTDQGLALMAALSAGGQTGQTGGEALRELITETGRASGKLGFKVFAGAGGRGTDELKTVQGIYTRWGDISRSPQMAAMFEKAFGARAFNALSIILKNLDKVQVAQKALANSSGTVDKAYAVFGEHGGLLFERLQRSFEVIEISLGAALLPAVESFGRGLLGVSTWLKKVGDAHPWIIKLAAGFAAVSAAVLLVGGGLTLASSALLGFVSFVPAIKAFTATLQLGAVATKAWAAAQWLFNAAVSAGSLVTKLFTAAQWALNVAMDANPIGLAIAGIALLAGGVYEVIKHWSAIKAWVNVFFKGIRMIFSIFSWGRGTGSATRSPRSIKRSRARSKAWRMESQNSSSATVRSRTDRCTI